MSSKAVFEGLVLDEYDNPVTTTYVGSEPHYVVDDNGFLRHIPCEQVDSQVLDFLKKQILENKEILTEQTAKMIGQEDIFTKAVIENQLEDIDKQMDQLMNIGLPNNNRDYLGLMGFRIRIDIHGEVIEIIQPAASEEE